MEENLVRAIYSLVAVLVGNILVSWGKGIFAKYTLVKQLIAETKYLCAEIKANGEMIERERKGNSFPLMATLEPIIHNAKMADIVLHKNVGTMASRFVSNCRHYNRIMEIGERDSHKEKRKSEVLNQGGLIHNEPEVVFEQMQDGTKKSYVGQARNYLDELGRLESRYRGLLRFFPWYLFLIWKDDTPPTGTSSHI